MKKQLIFFCLLAVFSFACSDDSMDKNQINFVSAVIDSESWAAEETYTQKARGENGPLTIVGEGEGYTLELVLGGVEGPGTYEMGTTRSGRIKLGNTTYSTMDVANAGTIEITRYEDNKVEGTFTFNAQWLSAGNRMEVRDGSFSVFYY